MCVFDCATVYSVFSNTPCKEVWMINLTSISSSSFPKKKLLNWESERDSVRKMPLAQLFIFLLKNSFRNIHSFLQHVKQIETVCGASRLYSTVRREAVEEPHICVPPYTSSWAQTLLAQRNMLTKWWGSGFFYSGQGTDSKPPPLPSTWIATD